MREPPELARDTVSTEEVSRRLDAVRERYQMGLMSASSFQAFLQSYQFKDDVGHLWSPGASSGQWYLWGPAGWTLAQPPTHLNVPPELARKIDPLVVRVAQADARVPGVPADTAANVCAKCGAAKTGSRFCTSCGTRL